MPGRHGLAGDLAAALRLPQGHRVEQAVHHTALAPQHQQVAGQLLAVRAPIAVVLQVYAGAGAVVLAGGVQRLGIAKAALVVGQRPRLDVVQPALPQPPSLACK
jgi:hypothetical protein